MIAKKIQNQKNQYEKGKNTPRPNANYGPLRSKTTSLHNYLDPLPEVRVCLFVCMCVWSVCRDY